MSVTSEIKEIVAGLQEFADGVWEAFGPRKAAVKKRAPVKKKKKKVTKKKKPAPPTCTVAKPKPVKKHKPKKAVKRPKAVKRAKAVRAAVQSTPRAAVDCTPAKVASAGSGGTPAKPSGSTTGAGAGSVGGTVGVSGGGGSGAGAPSGPPPSDWTPPSPPLYFAPNASTGGDTGWLNVTDYGAHGDGSADDTAALNAACDAARQINVDGGVAVVYLPAGVYNVSGSVNVFNVFLRGDGMGASKIQATSDWARSPNGSWVLDQQPSANGVGAPASGPSGTGATPEIGTWIEDLWLSGPGSVTPGQIPCNLSGIRVGNGAGYRRVQVEGFFAGAFLFSQGERILGPGKQGGNYYGIYYGEPSPAAGDQLVSDVEIDGCAWASIGISANMTFENALFRSVLLGSSPFGIYKEEAASGSVALSGCVLSNVHFDSCGNGNIFVNGPSGGGGDVRGCVFQATQSSNVFASATAISNSTSDVRGRSIGRTLAPIDLLGGTWDANEVQASDPGYIGANNSNYSAVVACGQFTGGRYGPGETAITQVVADGKRFTTGQCSGDALLVDVGTPSRLLPAAGSGILTSDLVEGASGVQGVQRATSGGRPLGVALHAANSGDTVPVAYSGVVTVNCGTNTISPDDPLKPDPSQAGCVITTSLTDPGVIGVAQQASSSGTVQAILSSL